MFRARVFRPLLKQVRLHSTANSKPKSSAIPWIVSSFIVGSVTAHFLPISSIFKEIINEKLPTDVDGIKSFQDKLERKAESLDVYQELSQNEDYKVIRAWNYIDSNSQQLDGNYNVSATTLSVPGGIAIKPYLFVNEKEKKTVTIIHVGERLCGYPFLIHGGILFTIVDEILKRSSSFKFGIDIVNEYKPNLIKTEKLALNYYFPTFANNFIVIKSEIIDGKVLGRIEDCKGKLLVKSVGEFSKI